jgi:hypothetical protein
MGRPLGHFCKEFSSKTEYVHAKICPGTICGWTVKKLKTKAIRKNEGNNQ